MNSKERKEIDSLEQIANYLRYKKIWDDARKDGRIFKEGTERNEYGEFEVYHILYPGERFPENFTVTPGCEVYVCKEVAVGNSARQVISYHDQHGKLFYKEEIKRRK
jgi:hypothetical protein